MTGTFNFDAEKGGVLHKIGHDCSESMPWLGVQGKRGECGEYLRVVQRGASNVYFPLTVSSIYLPLWGESTGRTINKILDAPNVWDTLTAGLDDGKYIQAFRCEMVSKLSHDQIDPVELRKAAQKKLDGTPGLGGAGARSEEEFRRQEYEALRTGRGGDTTDLLVEVRELAEHIQDQVFG